jgi:hypothetical protein
MQTTVWIAVALTVLRSGWMTFDGTRALVVGDYVTPRSGPRAGQLGPWAALVEAIGLDPRGAPMKLVFVVIGAAGLVAAGLLATGHAWGRRAVVTAAVASLWYLPVGTAMSVIVIVMVLLSSR